MPDDNATHRALDAIERNGYAHFTGTVDGDLLRDLRDDLPKIYRKRRAVQERNGIAAGMEGTCHHLLGEATAMDRFVAGLPLHETIRGFFDGPYILNSFGGFINEAALPDGYIGAIHRDVRSFSPDFRLMLNMLVMVDDFTAENGATWLMPGSHRIDAKPAERVFYAAAKQAEGKAGDILLFDSRLWHAAGRNRTDKPRRALTLTFSRPFMKPQLDYPRFLGAAYAADLSPAVRQVLGYDARVPATIGEFYQPPERRAYKPGQG